MSSQACPLPLYLPILAGKHELSGSRVVATDKEFLTFMRVRKTVIEMIPLGRPGLYLVLLSRVGLTFSAYLFTLEYITIHGQMRSK